MDEAERKRIIAESRALLERLRLKQEPAPAQAAPPEPETDFVSLDQLRDARRDAEHDWYAERDAERESERRRRRAIERRHAEPPPAPDWSGVDQRIAAAIAAAVENEREFSRNVLTQVAADLYERLHKLEATAHPTTGESGKVLDLPSSFLRRVN